MPTVTYKGRKDGGESAALELYDKGGEPVTLPLSVPTDVSDEVGKALDTDANRDLYDFEISNSKPAAKDGPGQTPKDGDA